MRSPPAGGSAGAWPARGQISCDLLGILAGIAAAGVMAGGIVLTKRWRRPEGVGAATIAGYAWLSVVGTLLAYPIWFHGIGKLPVVVVSFLSLLSPAVATILGWWFLGESLTWQGAGFVLALTAIAAAQLSPDVVRKLVRIPATTKGE